MAATRSGQAATKAAARKTTSSTSATGSSATRKQAVNGTRTTGTAATKKAASTKAAPAKKAAATKSAAKAGSATKAASGPARKATSAAGAAGRTAAKKAPAKAATTSKAAASTTKAAAPRKSSPAKSAPAKPATPSVRADESPWTAAELKAIRSELEADSATLRGEIDQAETELVGLMRDSGDGAGDDQADAGAKTYEREQEMTVANNARDLLSQNERALGRLDDGSYGRCESCGNAIGKLRLQAQPRATLCLDCKKREERR